MAHSVHSGNPRVERRFRDLRRLHRERSERWLTRCIAVTHCRGNSGIWMGSGSFKTVITSKMQDCRLDACSPNRSDTAGGVAATKQQSRRWSSACPASNIKHRDQQDKLAGQGGGAENLDICQIWLKYLKLQDAFWGKAGSCYQLSFGTLYK